MAGEALMTITGKQVEAGQAVYTKPMLAVYDLLVVVFSNRLVWRRPSKHILALYDRYVPANRWDVGVGTGYFLDRCRFPKDRPRLALMDLNPNCLEAASTRLARYRPAVYRANVLDPISFDDSRFESISLTYLLHCLPGTIRTKSAVVRHLTTLLNPGGMMFGATLLSGGVNRNWAARRLMAFYNSKSIFTNEQDDLETLRDMLSEKLTGVTAGGVGGAARFAGGGRRGDMR